MVMKTRKVNLEVLQMLPVADAAAILGISPVRLKQILKEDGLPHARGPSGYITLEHGTLRDLMKARGIQYQSRVCTLGIEKGGTGKSTCSLLLSLYAARHRGAKVLLCDMDPEASASLFLAPDDFEIGTAGTILEVFSQGRQILDFVQSSRFPGVDFLPSRSVSRRVDKFIHNANPKKFLRERMVGLREIYDLVLFDVPPSFGPIHAACYLSSDYVAAIVNGDVFSLESLALTREDIFELAEKFDSKPPEFRVFRNRFGMNRRNAKETHAELQRDFSRELLPFFLRESAVVANCINDGRSPFEGRGNSDLKDVFGDLFDALMKPDEVTTK